MKPLLGAKQRLAAKDLAVRYSAFNLAMRDGDDNSIIVWGGMLLDTQAATGVELFEPELIGTIVESARRRSPLKPKIDQPPVNPSRDAEGR